MSDTSNEHNKRKLPRIASKKRKQLERDLELANQELFLRNQELAQINKTLSLLRTIDALVLESHVSLEVVCQHITEAINQASDYPFIGLLTRSSRSRDDLTLNSWSGRIWRDGERKLGFSHPIRVKTDYDWFRQPLGTTKISFDSIPDDVLAVIMSCSEADVRRFRQLVPLKSLYLVKLTARRHLVGVLVIGFQKPQADLQKSDTILIDSISENIGVALDNKLLFEENQAVLRQLRESNNKLRELDEAKDDFVSMASHQLRTPLTSVKGYISMIKEGDAGKVTPTQKKMLEQAFFSSQRMVYLIADLLNVSRLRTGKFIIEPKPVDLMQVVGEEIEQLIEIAKSRGLTLKYEKPDTKTPSKLMLDETKTRQIIMNFVDNAIYYTPSGGEVIVKLSDTPTTVELRVVDNGIGVPRSEQAHLFTKFYRAGNARKARPDGTGLGLFMAKKVIVAQGGSLIFESKEDQGSTFGFIFSKHKLSTPEDANSKKV